MYSYSKLTELEPKDLDFRLWENFITENGAPIHGMRFRKDGALAEIEAFCDTARKSTCFIKASVKNTTDQPMKPMFSFMLRTGTIHKVAGSADHWRPKRIRMNCISRSVLTAKTGNWSGTITPCTTIPSSSSTALSARSTAIRSTAG